MDANEQQKKALYHPLVAYLILRLTKALYTNKHERFTPQQAWILVTYSRVLYKLNYLQNQ